MTVLITTRKIAAAGTDSEAFDAGGAIEGSFSIPSAITGTSIQPQFSNDQTNWTNVGSPISIAVNGTYAVPADVFKAAYGRLVSNSAEAAERIITLGLRR